ncbi:cytochrome c oxidase assembly factor 6 homolog isoform X2 [Glandiceps talaboti]
MSSAPPLNAEGRQKCWNSRDEYFTCLDKNNEDKSQCTDLFKLFENNCPNTWVKYFHKRRDFEKYKQQLKTEGAQLAKEDSSS